MLELRLYVLWACTINRWSCILATLSHIDCDIKHTCYTVPHEHYNKSMHTTHTCAHFIFDYPWKLWKLDPSKISHYTAIAVFLLTEYYYNNVHVQWRSVQIFAHQTLDYAIICDWLPAKSTQQPLSTTAALDTHSLTLTGEGCWGIGRTKTPEAGWGDGSSTWDDEPGAPEGFDWPTTPTCRITAWS